MKHRDGAIELRLNRRVTRDWKIYFAEFFRLTGGMFVLLMLSKGGNRARQACAHVRRTQRTWRSHTDPNMQRIDYTNKLVDSA
jgi:hypothetical protein